MNLQAKTSALKSVIAMSMVIAMLVLGFCPLRNTLGTLLFRPASAVPKTNGSHLLIADDVCKVQIINKATTGQQHTLLPPLALVVLACFCGYGLCLFNRIMLNGRNLSQQNAVAVPIYLRNRVWRI